MFRKILIIVLTLLLTFTLCGTALAADEPSEQTASGGIITPMYTYISTTSCAMSINSAGKASVAASINAYSNVDRVEISGYLQYYSGGWRTVKNWSEKFSGNYGAMAKTYYVTKGYQYRWICYYYAYDGSVMESTSDAVYWDYY